MDNFKFDITTDRNLDAVLSVAFSEWKTATHWKNDDDKRLILAWHETKVSGFHPFLVPVTAETVKPFILDWLKNLPQPKDSPMWEDVMVKKAFRVYNEHWGSVDGDPYSFVAIEPAEAWYGK